MAFPKVTINGVELTEGQAMTVHVALQSFVMEMEEQDALGTDEHGQIMRQNYLDRINEINAIYIGAQG